VSLRRESNSIQSAISKWDLEEEDEDEDEVVEEDEDEVVEEVDVEEEDLTIWDLPPV
jgi:hypothetical protein